MLALNITCNCTKEFQVQNAIIDPPVVKPSFSLCKLSELRGKKTISGFLVFSSHANIGKR